MATADDRIAALEEELRSLRADQQRAAAGPAPAPTPSPAPSVTVKFPPKRKLRYFSGKGELRVEDWIIEAKSILETVSSEDRASYLIGHLEGVARDEVRYASDADRSTAEGVFTLLEKQFGERRTNAHLKRLLYDRVQSDKETVREFSRSLLSLSDRVKEPVDVKLKLLCEVFCENVHDRYVRRELKKFYGANPDVSFNELREEGIRLADDEREVVRVRVRSVEGDEPVAAAVSSDSSDLRSMMAEMLKTQQQLLNVLTNIPFQASSVQQQPQQQQQPRKRWIDNVECFKCHRKGHFKRDCPLWNQSQQQSKHSGVQARTCAQAQGASGKTRAQARVVSATDSPLEDSHQGNGLHPLF